MENADLVVREDLPIGESQPKFRRWTLETKRNDNLFTYQQGKQFFEKINNDPNVNKESIKVIGTNRFKKYFTIKSMEMNDILTQDEYFQNKSKPDIEKMNGFYMFQVFFRVK